MDFQQFYWDIPPVTRFYCTTCFLTTLAVRLELITAFQIYFNPVLIFKGFQFWRLVTNYLFFDDFGLHFFFRMLFTYHYCRSLEEGSFRGRTSDLVFLLLYGGAVITVMSMVLYYYLTIHFLGDALTMMIFYVWSRRNRFGHMRFLGIFVVMAPYFPFVLLAFGFILNVSISQDIFGIIAGHSYYFLVDVFPKHPRGFKLLETPNLLKRVFDEEDLEYQAQPLPEEPE